MSFITCVATAILTIQAAHSYILLTANLEDVQAIAKQLAASPVADQLQHIWRRATNQFSQRMVQSRPQPQYYQKRANPKLDEVEDQAEAQQSPSPNDQLVDEDGGARVERRNTKQNEDDDDLVALGRNASMYLKSIRKIFERVQ